MRYFKNFEYGERQSNHEFYDIIFIKFSLNGHSKLGIINLNLSYNSEKDDLQYLHIEYSDDEIKSFVDKNPSLLIKLESLRN